MLVVNVTIDIVVDRTLYSSFDASASMRLVPMLALSQMQKKLFKKVPTQSKANLEKNALWRGEEESNGQTGRPQRTVRPTVFLILLSSFIVVLSVRSPEGGRDERDEEREDRGSVRRLESRKDIGGPTDTDC